METNWSGKYMAHFFPHSSIVIMAKGNNAQLIGKWLRE
jgi:hypothetical protein